MPAGQARQASAEDTESGQDQAQLEVRPFHHPGPPGQVVFEPVLLPGYYQT
jgi:hypothetical protein